MTEVRDWSTARRWAETKQATVVFVGPDTTQIPPLAPLLPDYAVVGPASAALDRLAATGTMTFGADPRHRSAEALLEDTDVQAWLDGLDAPAVMVFKTSFALEQLAGRHGWRLLAAPANLSRRWENKVAFAELGADLGLPMAPTLVVGRDASFEEVAGRLGADLVIQAPHGYSGARTLRVNDRQAYRAALETLRVPKVRLAAYVPGRPVTLTACVTAAGLAVARPCVQITGEPDLTPYTLGSCGNDWVAPLPGMPEALLAAAETLGEALKAAGFVGLFGVDFVVRPDGTPVVIEVNPRLVASLALYSEAELAAGRVPLLLRHVLAHLDPSADRLPLDVHWAALPVSQMILHNLAGETRTASGVSGLYRLDPGAHELAWLADGGLADLGTIDLDGTDDLDGPEESGGGGLDVVVVSQPVGRQVNAGGELGRVQGRTALTGPDGRLTAGARRLAQAVRALLLPGS